MTRIRPGRSAARRRLIATIWFSSAFALSMFGVMIDCAKGVEPSASAQKKADPPAKPPKPHGDLAAPPPTTQDVEKFDIADAMPRPLLRQLYQRELGSRYKPALEEKLYDAHVLIEHYFSTIAAKDRKAIVEDLGKTGLDATVLARITRIRMDWPELKGGGIFFVNEKIGPHQVRYFLGVPPTYDRAKSWPLVIKLPASPAFITVPPPNADQVAKLYRTWEEEELAHHPDAIVLMPLLNLDDLYGPSYFGMNTVIQPMRHAYERVNIDPSRVYLIGHSMAAHAVWNLGLHYTTYFAAINPFAGAATGDWQRLRLMNLRNVLPVVWHDADDPIIKVNFSRSIVKGLRSLKLDVDYEETKGVGHAPSAEIVDRCYDKLVARQRELYPTEIYLQSNRPDTMFNRVDWVQVWQPLNPGKDRRMLLANGRGFFIANENAWSVQAAHPSKNRYELATKNVETLRLYINDQMSDFREPITVIVNKKPRFEGIVKPSIEEMLKDQIFLGRGWRSFASVIDIDLAPPTTKPSSAPVTQPRVP